MTRPTWKELEQARERYHESGKGDAEGLAYAELLDRDGDVSLAKRIRERHTAKEAKK